MPGGHPGATCSPCPLLPSPRTPRRLGLVPQLPKRTRPQGMNDLHGGRGTNSQSIENFDLKFGTTEMSFEELGCIFLFRESKRPQARWKGCLRGAAPELGVLSSSGASQMAPGASERDSPNPAQAWRLRLTFASSLALFGEAVPTGHWDHSPEALSLPLLWNSRSPSQG